MKTVVVPAQVTSVEDKIASSLSVTQLFLLAAPLFIGGLLYMLLPPLLRFAVYKLVLIVCIVIAGASLALRVKDRLVLTWVMVLLRYFMRPRIFVADKNDLFGRHKDSEKLQAGSKIRTKDAKVTQRRKLEKKQFSRIEIKDLITVEEAIARPEVDLILHITRQGGLYGSITKAD